MSLLRTSAVLVACLGAFITSCTSPSANEETLPAVLVELEARYPQLADLEITSGTRARLFRSDSGESLSYETGGFDHVQNFEPNPGFTLEDVANEISQAAEEAGFAVEDLTQRMRCGRAENPVRTIRIFTNSQPSASLPDLGPSVSLKLAAPC